MPDWEYGTLLTDDGKTLYWKMLKPPKFDAQNKYPVYMTNYGGPGSQGVLDSWNPGFGERAYLEQGYIIFVCDNRGTGARGRDWMKCTYRNLGEWESYDQAQAAKWVASLPFVASKRISMFGWSYGGYMAAMCILRHPGVWKCAIAGAPVTAWEFYDSIYTERYMALPKDNPDGYKSSACLTYAGQLDGSLLLLHGTSDDNVHVQNTMRLAEELQKAAKQFDLMVYPHEKHGIGRQAHMNRLMADFLKRNL